MLNINILALLSLILVSCNTNTIKVKNERPPDMTPEIKLILNDSIRFILDSASAPKPKYIQLFTDTNENRILSFLNTHTNSIYLYNYSTTKLLNVISFNKEGPDGIQIPTGYYIKNWDSIYIYNKLTTELILTNSKSKIFNKISLKGDGKLDPWFLYYPQYNPETETPLFETGTSLLFTGQSFVSIPDSLINKFKFSAHINFNTNDVSFHHSYPEELYGFSSNWEGGEYTEVFPQIHPIGDSIIYSFPVSHHLYISGLRSNSYRKVYAGSYFARAIRSMEGNPLKTSRPEMFAHHGKQDIYAAVIYDNYRKVYYRFLRKGIRNATIHTRLEDKPIIVIIMDENFKYLGETEIGTGKEWNWHNSFITREGLNIEYIEKDFKEVYLTFKIFTLKSL